MLRQGAGKDCRQPADGHDRSNALDGIGDGLSPGR